MKSMIIFEEAKAKLESSASSANILDRKAFFLCGAYLTGITILITVVFELTPHPSLYIVLIGLLVSLSILLYSAMRVKKFASLGSNASALIGDPSPKESLLCSIALAYEEKAEHNNKISAGRGTAINISILVFLLSAISAVVLPYFFEDKLMQILSHLVPME